MSQNDLTFKQKIVLYKDLIKYFRIESIKNPPKEEMKNMLNRLEKWGEELKVRQNYYDV